MAAMDHLSTIHHTFDSTVNYNSGEFNVQRNSDGYSSPPIRPQKPTPQKALIVSSEGFVQEKLLINSVDRREKIQEATSYPYCIHTQIESIFQGRLYGGTGAMVGPHHILTCGHNVHSEKKWAEKITVYPGRQGKMAPYGEAKVARAYLLQSWVDKEEAESDIALLILDRSVGLLTGWGGIASAPNRVLEGRTFHITGYPGDKNFIEMWGTSNKIGKIFDETFGYDIDTTGGQSGSAIWSNDFGNPTIVGVHTLGANSLNHGVRISNKKFNGFLEPMILQTYRIAESPEINPQLQPSSFHPTRPSPAPPTQLFSHQGAPSFSRSRAPASHAVTYSSSFSSPKPAFAKRSYKSVFSPSPSNLAPIYSSPAPSLPQTAIPAMAFGRAKWAEYFGDVGVEPQLPPNIEEILNRQCTFWPSKKVRDTHLLILIPHEVDGKPFHLNALEGLLKKNKKGKVGFYKYYEDSVKRDIGTKSMSSHWALITHEVIPTYTTNSSYASYELPTALEAAAASAIKYLQSWWLYSRIYTRCKEETETFVGSEGGLYIYRAGAMRDGCLEGSAYCLRFG